MFKIIVVTMQILIGLVLGLYYPEFIEIDQKLVNIENQCSK